MSKQAQPLEEKLETVRGQVEALGEQLGAIFQKPQPAPEPVGLSPAIFTQDGWSEWAGQAGHPEWLQVLATYPHWLVLGCAGVLGIGLLWLGFRMLKWTLTLLIPLVIVAVVVWCIWFFWLSERAAS
ncbi:hypothetical protein AXK12_05180 [Cephaloticoccus capnophilus]|uniref:Uncharacterized protein n=1 Tax=Cephaloticoccus capnophilus TaxID=1548208 RepID=A0A139SLD2_9BACT|nr:hypothetical protein [Cephaloticoccus capnophilus]KXU35368.1 hypothetical protein AXK12_05180 [Cephaloticoccus capnophilus]